MNDAPTPPHGIDDAALAPSARTQGSPSRQQPVDISEEVHFLDYVKVLHKRRWLAITVLSLVLIGTAVQTFTAVPIYRANVRLLIDSEDPNVVNFKDVIDEQQSKADYYTTQYNILQSRSLARKTLDTLKLWNTPPFGGNMAPKPYSVAAMTAKATDWVTGLWSSPAAASPATVPAPDETAAQSSAIDGFLGRLRVTPIRNSRLVDVSYDLPDPAMATSIVNTFARSYIDQNLDYKFGATKDASNWLEQQLTEQRKHVEDSEVALQHYREQHGAIPMQDGENIVVQKLTQLNAAVTSAKADRIQQQAMYEQLKQQQAAGGSLETFPAILTNNYIQQQKAVLADLLRQQSQLAETYGDRNEKMIRIKSQVEAAQAKLDGEIQKVVQSVNTEYNAAVDREKNLVLALDEQKAEALRMNDTAIEYNVLNREVESSKQLYDTLMQRAKETGVSGALRTSNIRIVDPAEKPRSPISPNKRLNLLIALFGGGVFAVGLAFFFEYMDNRLKTPDEIRARLGLAHLGLLPLLSTKRDDYPLLSDPVPPNFVEAFRLIRTNVIFSSMENDGQTLLVTSTGPNEGKSLVAANLAISLAQSGKRVLLVDADMRKPRVHSAFGVAQEPGLSNVLVGEAKASASVRQSPVTNLWILPSGRIPPNPAELLGSDRLKSYSDAFCEHFDWIVIDSPPVMAVADASIITHNTEAGVVFVVGAEMTSRHAALRAVEQLELSGARFLGAVLNRADLKRNAYYYSEYYKRDYATYYTTT